MFSDSANILTPVSYQVIHSITGRIRFRIPRLQSDPKYTNRLQQNLESLAFVRQIRINPTAQSIAIIYQPQQVTEEDLQVQLAQAIEKAAYPLTLQEAPLKSKIPDIKTEPIVEFPMNPLPISAPVKELEQETILSFETIPQESYSEPSVQRFRIVFTLGSGNTKSSRFAQQEKIINYSQLSQQLQLIHRVGGKVIEIKALF